MQINQLIDTLTSAKGARFVSLVYRAKGTGELARHTLLMGANYGAAYRADLAHYRRKLEHLQGVALFACAELCDSLRESLTVGIGNNSANTRQGIFDVIVPGVKIHRETGMLYVNGFSISKQVIEPGIYKKVNSSEKTLAKNALRKEGKLGKFREFVMDCANIVSVKGNGKTLEFA